MHRGLSIALIVYTASLIGMQSWDSETAPLKSPIPEKSGYMPFPRAWSEGTVDCPYVSMEDREVMPAVISFPAARIKLLAYKINQSRPIAQHIPFPIPSDDQDRIDQFSCNGIRFIVYRQQLGESTRCCCPKKILYKYQLFRENKDKETGGTITYDCYESPVLSSKK